MKLVKLVAIAIITILLSFLVYFAYKISPMSFSSQKERIVVEPSEGLDSVSEKLQSSKLIRSKNALTFALSIRGFTTTIEPGAYLVPHNTTVFGVADILLYHPYQKFVTITPGMRKEQVASSLKKKFAWSDSEHDDFVKIAKEGYLLPETYLINTDYTPKEVAQKFMSTFQEKLDEGLYQQLLEKNIKVDTALKIASLIERESGGSEDKPIIAGVIWNRLDKGMRLQIDATNQYALGKEGDWWPILRGKSMSEIDSPYNTYRISALPPGPICNPSLESIKAVINSADTDCLFYLHDHNKQIHCAVTYEKHLENIEEFLK